MILIDGSHLLHRVLNTPQGDLADANGYNTGGAHGFLISLGTYVRSYRHQRGVIVAWDLGVPLHRREIFSEYKPHKHPIGEVDHSLLSFSNKEESVVSEDMSDDQYRKKYEQSIRILHGSVLPLIGCLSLRCPNTEADDIIAVLADELGKDEEIVVGTSDYDYHQMVNENVTIHNVKDNQVWDLERVIADNELDRGDWVGHWLLRKALVGDGSDGIPGFEGVGGMAASSYADQIHESMKSGKTLEEACQCVERPPRARWEGFELIQKSHKEIQRNIDLMDLSYPIRNNLPMYQDIKKAICQSDLVEMDLWKAEEVLESYGMQKSKVYLGDISEANCNQDPHDYVERFQ